MANNNIFEFTDANFATDVEGSEGLVVVDFWAPWCGPCRAVAPIIEQLAAEYAGRVRFGKLNVDDNPQVAARYGIRSIPTIGVFKDGEPVDGAVGALPKPMLARLIEGHLPAAA
ncbi:MAG TPA: thioredoxin [Longimicrobiales bacterium]|nr:thioredoxin [Longimicrobiales bacterium]